MLEVKSLSASYGDVKVFSDLSFEIKRGDYLVIVGENGSGKSLSLIHISEPTRRTQ